MEIGQRYLHWGSSLKAQFRSKSNEEKYTVRTKIWFDLLYGWTMREVCRRAERFYSATGDDDDDPDMCWSQKLPSTVLTKINASLKLTWQTAAEKVTGLGDRQQFTYHVSV